MDKDKIQEILLNIIGLILSSKEINMDFYSNLIENYSSNFESIFKDMIELNNRFSYYEIREDLDGEAEAKRVGALKEELNKAKERTSKLRKEFNFKISQSYLKFKEFNELIEDIRHLIEDL